MFNCAVCGNPAPPATKPIFHTLETRHVDYSNTLVTEDEYGKRSTHQIDSRGTEIVREVMICLPDAVAYYDYPAPEPKPVVARKLRTLHEEIPAEQFTQPFARVVAFSSIRRLEHQSKRAERDINASIPLLKYFGDNNKNFDFRLDS